MPVALAPSLPLSALATPSDHHAHYHRLRPLTLDALLQQPHSFIDARLDDVPPTLSSSFIDRQTRRQTPETVPAIVLTTTRLSEHQPSTLDRPLFRHRPISTISSQHPRQQTIVVPAFLSSASSRIQFDPQLIGSTHSNRRHHALLRSLRERYRSRCAAPRCRRGRATSGLRRR
ncbi:hypothetical protein CB0940_00787 [Cercospora beticola]|uniref:Uncharacterized protein n=1 Tax=Cercospora beticola TaxID=122368 RepID=A0A2G5ID19_CERBT|nr:hypothetical protein CB0940_00787 [Cercospora beticola]PIB02582.1 hypothetical protein CB0940_00787 [Cercospora beticola]